MIEQDMAWAVFTREFNWSRPASPLSFHVLPMDAAQQRPRDVVDAAVKAGAAFEVDAPDRGEARRLKKKGG